MTRLFDHRLQLLAGMKGDDPAGAYRYFLAGLGVAARALRLVAQLEVAEARKLDALATLERAPDFLEKRLDHVLGLALVQTDLLEQKVGQLGLSQRHHWAPRFPFYVRRLAENLRPSRATSASRAASASASVRVLSVSCITTRNARLFRFSGTPAPRNRLRSMMRRTIGAFPPSMASKMAWTGVSRAKSMEMSRSTTGWLDGACGRGAGTDWSGSASSSKRTGACGSSYFCCHFGCSSPIQPTAAPSTCTRADRPG